ncbi:hypothetical protein OF83DRAFT_1174531 [Amylostereum chailletii]|nr:hypothetical protein OF83DRAFT_1174531 [Amylostereum chailletii]
MLPKPRLILPKVSPSSPSKRSLPMDSSSDEELPHHISPGLSKTPIKTPDSSPKVTSAAVRVSSAVDRASHPSKKAKSLGQALDTAAKKTGLSLKPSPAGNPTQNVATNSLSVGCGVRRSGHDWKVLVRKDAADDDLCDIDGIQPKKKDLRSAQALVPQSKPASKSPRKAPSIISLSSSSEDDETRLPAPHFAGEPVAPMIKTEPLVIAVPASRGSEEWGPIEDGDANEEIEALRTLAGEDQSVRMADNIEQESAPGEDEGGQNPGEAGESFFVEDQDPLLKATYSGLVDYPAVTMKMDDMGASCPSDLRSVDTGIVALMTTDGDGYYIGGRQNLGTFKVSAVSKGGLSTLTLNGNPATFVTFAKVTDSTLDAPRSISGETTKYTRDIQVWPIAIEWDRGLLYWAASFGTNFVDLFVSAQGEITFGTVPSSNSRSSNQKVLNSPTGPKLRSPSSRRMGKGKEPMEPDVKKHLRGETTWGDAKVPVWDLSLYFRHKSDGAIRLPDDASWTALFETPDKYSQRDLTGLALPADTFVAIFHTVMRNNLGVMTFNMKGICVLALPKSSALFQTPFVIHPPSMFYLTFAHISLQVKSQTNF